MVRSPFHMRAQRGSLSRVRCACMFDRDGNEQGERTLPATASRARRDTPAPRSRPRSPLRVVPRVKEARVTASRDELARQYSQCRTLGHTWHHIGWADPSLRRPIGDYNVLAYVSRCDHCQTERTKWVSRQGHRGSTTYAYPDGYSRHGDEALTRDEWRRTWVVTMLGDRA